MSSSPLAGSVHTGSVQTGLLYDVARYVSIVGHPFLVIPASAAARSVLHGDRAHAASTAAAVALVFFTVSAAILGGVRAGRFNDFDVSERQRRPGFYVLLTVVTLALALWFRDEPGAFRACWIASAVLGVCGLLNRWLKVSLHTAFALYAAGLWWAWSASAALVGLPLVAAVAGSRVLLGRHSWTEVGAGALVGGVGAALLVFCR